MHNLGPGLFVIRIGKTKWTSQLSDWLVAQLQFGKYGFNKDTLEPDYPYFEYWFVDGQDALAFTIIFPDTFAGEWTLWNI